MDQILQYFETELDYMRRAFEGFEKTHPQKAKSLGISAGRSSDPDVQRLADSLALHAARLSKRLDDNLPETALDLMRILAPSFLLGAPSYAAVKLAADANQFADPLTLSAGTELPVHLEEDVPHCRFVAARSVDLNPIHISDVRLERAPLPFEVPADMRGCEAALCVTLAPLDPGQSLRDLNLDQVELYVSAKGGRKQRLVEVLSGEVVGLAYAAQSGRAAYDSFAMIDSHFGLVMQGDTGTFLPRPATQSPALSRLRDFLAYPDKSAYFRLDGTAHGFQRVPSGPVEIRFFLTGEGAKLLSTVEPGDIETNVVPVVNLFVDQSRPVRYDYARSQVPVLPTASAHMHVESLQIRDLRQLSPEGEHLLPEITSPDRRQDMGLPSWQERFEVGNFEPARREVSFSTTSDLSEQAPQSLDFVASLYCSNGSAACAPRPGATVFFEEEALADCPFSLLAEPTVPLAPDVASKRIWDVMSMVNGNFATVFESENPLGALREMLHLCSPSGYSDAANAIWDVTVTQSIAPVTVGSNVLLAAGSKIEVVLDCEALPFARNVFATALQYVFSAMVSYDRFFQLQLRERGCAEPFKVFDRQHGSQTCA